MRGSYFVGLLRILHFGNAFFNSATPALVTLVPRNLSYSSCFNLATSLRPASVIWVRNK